MYSSKSVLFVFALSALFTCYVNMTPVSESENIYTFRKTVEISYEDVLKKVVPTLQEEIDTLFQQNCYGDGVQKGPGGYQCGEYPIGKVINSKVKKLEEVSVDLPKDYVLVKMKNGSIELKNAFNFDVFMDREQKRNWTESNLLDTKSKTSIVVQDPILETMTLRNSPKGSSLYSLACTLFPGVDLTTKANSFNTDITYHWKFWFISGTERLSTFTNIRDGEFSVDNAKICAILKTEIVDNKPKISVMDISYPEVNDLKVKSPLGYGTRVEFHTLGAKIANWLLGVFTDKDLEQLIAEELEKQMKKAFDSKINVAVSGIKSGKAFEQLFNESVREKLTHNVVVAYKKVVARQYDPTPLKYRQDGTLICVDVLRKQAFLGGIKIKDSVINEFCKDVYADIEVVPFAVNASYDKEQCYDYSFSLLSYVAKGKNDWWKKGCGLAANITAKVNLPRLKVLRCLDSVKIDESGDFDFLTIKDCVNDVNVDILDLPKSVIDEIQKLGLVKLEDIQKLAIDRGVDPQIVKNLSQLLK